MKTYVLIALVAFLAMMPAATALEGDGPGGACDGLLVDVLCEDATQTCQPGGGCETTYRDCLVWIVYLDMTWSEYAPEPVCEDQPYG